MSKPADTFFSSSSAATGQSTVRESEPAMVSSNSTPDYIDFPCSVAQERFWLLDRLEPGNSSYNVAVRWRLEGRVTTSLLESAWAKIIERHEILRTIFVELDGAPVQRVMTGLEFRISEIDLSAMAAELQHAEGDRIGMLEARAPFDLTSGPIIRVTLLRFSPTLCIILVTTHQIVSDGWSIGVMAREMGQIYQALSRNQQPALEPLAIQYADYTLWQLEWLKVRGTQAETEYWTRQLNGIKPFKVIPDRPRPAIPNTTGAIVSRVFPRELTNKAQALAAEHGVTLFAAALGALCATLARFTGESEIVLGTQVSDRDQVELEPMIGQFVNSLILRNNLADDPTFEQLMERVNETSQQALEHRHIPIERLLGMVKGEHSHANSPAISVNFIFQKTFIQNTPYDDFTLIDMPSLPAGAIYDLNLFMVERPDGWRFSCQYNTAQFEASTAERLLSYIQSGLESAVSKPQRRVSELTLSPMNETRVMLGRLNDTRSLYPRELTLVKLFEAQVMRAPLATALSHNGRDLSYGDLDAAANRFSEYLQVCGVERGARIAVYLAESTNLLIAILGILKAGAIYVPMSADDPPAQRAQLATAAALAGVIGEPQDLSLVINKSTKLIDVAAALAYRSRHSGASAIGSVDSDSAACMVFAPGFNATRTISLSHRHVSNLIFSLAKRPGLTERDVVVANRSIPPNIAFVEIFLALLNGARLVLPTEEDAANGRSLLRLLQRSGATVMFGFAQTWAKLLKAGWIGFPALKMLCPAAELSSRLAEQLTALDGEVWSVYGHRTSGLWSATHRVHPKQTFSSVGEPIANTSLYVLDSKLNIAPVGVTGQLFVGGDSIENAEIVPEGLHAAMAAPVKLARTGDLARLRATGEIEYLGSIGPGFIHLGTYVEPEEIEGEILRDPRVSEAAVLPGDELFDGGTIAAFLVLRKHVDSSSVNLIEQIRSRLVDALPAALVPGSFAVVEEIPRLASGEVDRRALLTINGDGATGKPSGEAEERLAEIWRSMLGVGSVGANENFFELGGHSLLAARMLAKVESVFGRRLQLATLFAAPTLRELARVLSKSDSREYDFRQVVKVQPNGSKPPLIALNNTGNYYLLAKHLGPDQPVISLQLFDPSIKTNEMPASLEEVAKDYVQLIRRVQPTGPYNLMGWCVAGALAFEVANQLSEAHEKVEHLFLMDSWVPRYIDRQPFVRRVIAAYTLSWQLILADWRKFRLGHQTFSTLLNNRSFVRDFKRAWARLTSPGTPAVAPVSSQLTTEDYDRWLLQYLQGLTAKYEPRVYPGTVTLFRSKDEPTGWLFDPAAGWGNFTVAGVKLYKVPGDHYTMFQSTGAVQMAEHIRTMIEE